MESLKELLINFKYEELVNYLKHKKTFKYSSKDEDKNIWLINKKDLSTFIHRLFWKIYWKQFLGKKCFHYTLDQK